MQVQVDVVHAERTETVVDVAHERLVASIGRPLAVRSGRQTALGHHDCFLPASAKSTRQERFRATGSVAERGVEQRDTQIQRSRDGSQKVLLVVRAVLAADLPGPEADDRDPEVRVTHGAVLHVAP
jgi:hypothetical protein